MLDHNPQSAKSSRIDCDEILTYLTTRQHVRPHSPVREVLEETIERFECCPLAVQRAVQWLGLHDQSPIGRLRRGELIQLARAVHRFWGHAVAAAASDNR